MRIINISKEQFLYLLLNNNSFDRGVYGNLHLVNDKLYKVYYKDFFDVYMTNDTTKLDMVVDNWLMIEEELSYGLRNPNTNLLKLERLLETKSKDLITGVLSYRGLLVGIEMNYYKDYITLSKASEMVSKEELEHYIEVCHELVCDLLLHNIVPNDIREDNIIVNIDTGDVKLIDLDDLETRYGPENYINMYPHNVYNVKKRLETMTIRLKEKNQNVLRKKLF